jgi:hypothetical protein
MVCEALNRGAGSHSCRVECHRSQQQGAAVLLIVLVGLDVQVHVIAGQAATYQQHQQDAEPTQRFAVPGTLA